LSSLELPSEFLSAEQVCAKDASIAGGFTPFTLIAKVNSLHLEKNLGKERVDED
jgi:hypothetical protein